MSKEFWNDRFSDTEYVYGTIENQFINEMSTIIPKHAKVACFAEGEGRNAVFLAKMGHDITTHDQSKVGLIKTKALAKQNKVHVKTVMMDLTKEKVEPNQYDTAVMVFGHVPKKDQQFFIENIIDSVKPGGYIILEVYSEDQFEYKTGGPPTVENLYHPKDMLEWIKPYQCIHFYYGEAERNEGKRHTGVGHVIQVVLEK